MIYTYIIYDLDEFTRSCNPRSYAPIIVRQRFKLKYFLIVERNTFFF